MGAIPGAAEGAALGAEAGQWILAALGLKALAEYVVKGLPEIGRNYWSGLSQAWLAARPGPLAWSRPHIDTFDVRSAARTLARAHVALFVLLLQAIVLRAGMGRGGMRALAESASKGRLGRKFGDWLLKNEAKLKNHPRLRPAEPGSGKVPTAAAAGSNRSRPEPKRNADGVSTRSPPYKVAPSATGAFGNVPPSLISNSGVMVSASPGRTTTILGRFGADMDNIINDQLAYPKTTDFGPKLGGYNVLNVDTDLTGDAFWDAYNRPFLDAAISRGDPMAMATPVTEDAMFNTDGTLTGYGREVQYLASQGYTYDPLLNIMYKK